MPRRMNVSFREHGTVSNHGMGTASAVIAYGWLARSHRLHGHAQFAFLAVPTPFIIWDTYFLFFTAILNVIHRGVISRTLVRMEPFSSYWIDNTLSVCCSRHRSQLTHFQFFSDRPISQCICALFCGDCADLFLRSSLLNFWYIVNCKTAVNKKKKNLFRLVW